MAYKIDFTESKYTARFWRKTMLRLFLAASVACVAWVVYDAYTIYTQPTLDMKLAEYETVARPVEEMNAAWDVCAKEYEALMKYYRLLWSDNATNLLNAMSASGSSGLGRGFRPRRWKLKTGGECRLDYVFVFNPGDKAEQAKEIEPALANAVTSSVRIATGGVNVSGVQTENLLHVNDLAIDAVFSLPGVKPFPDKEKVLANCVQEISKMRKKVLETKIADGKTPDGKVVTAVNLMMEYLDKGFGKGKGGFPVCTNSISVSGWFDRADQFIAVNRVPDMPNRKFCREAWRKIGEARFPWDRFKPLDNDALVSRTAALTSVSDGVKRFKPFLEQRREDWQRKLEPLAECYERNDVFNKPYVERDLKDRVAKISGIGRSEVVFNDEKGAEPSVFVKGAETNTITWVRWTLSLGEAVKNRGQDPGNVEQGTAGRLTLANLADCARRALELGPGYALDSATVDFGADGEVSGAVLEGLLPVRRIETGKEGGNVD